MAMDIRRKGNLQEFDGGRNSGGERDEKKQKVMVFKKIEELEFQK